jgi:hypothetical protein
MLRGDARRAFMIYVPNVKIRYTATAEGAAPVSVPTFLVSTVLCFCHSSVCVLRAY